MIFIHRFKVSALVAFGALAYATAACAQTRLKVLESPTAAYPPEVQQAGHQGTVEVKFTVTAEGAATDIEIERSSRSKDLDDAAQAAVKTWKFAPATDADGKPISAKAVVPFNFEKTNSIEFPKKPCKEFITEIKWFQEVFPEKKFSDMKLYKRTLGYMVMATSDKLALAKRYDSAYAKTIGDCEGTPDAMFWPMLAANAK